MAGNVKRRPYNAANRQANSRETKQRIMAAARQAMIEFGYRGATVAQIADTAQVNVDTVYALVGRKAVILRELIEQAISGTDEPVVAENATTCGPSSLNLIPGQSLPSTPRRFARSKAAWLHCFWRSAMPPRLSPRQIRSGMKSATEGQPICESSPPTSAKLEDSGRI